MQLEQSKTNRLVAAVCLVVGIVLFACARSPTDEAVSESDIHFVKGLVREISLEENYIVVKPKERESIRIFLDSKTKFVKLSSLEALSRRQWVKIWYEMEQGKSKAVKLEKIPDLGC